MSGPLAPYRVLDLTNERGLLAGQILADLGADVVQVEPPGGSSARMLRPFAHDDPAAGSLVWDAYTRNKRGITLDVTRDTGRDALRTLATTADVLIESFDPGYLGSLGLGYDVLAHLNPGLVVASITPFGQTGPKALWPAVDLTLVAASNYLISCGDEDRAPLRICVPQAFAHAAGEAAVGILMALRERGRSGLGQHVDVSAQQAASFCTLSSSLAARWDDAPNTRYGGGMKLGPFPLRLQYPAKDGYVAISFFFGSAVGPATARLMRWIHEEGEGSAELAETDWVGIGGLLMTGAVPFADFIHAQDVVAAFTAKRTKADLFAAARERHVLLTPISTTEDVRHDAHLAARDYWQPAAPGQSRAYPGPFAKFSATPIEYRLSRPALGQPTAEIVVEAAAPSNKIQIPKSPIQNRTAPLEGLRVLDLTWVMVGPSSVRTLADFGATVIKVESSTRVDTARTILPFKDGTPGAERSGVYNNYNAGKLGLTLNLATPEARGILEQLAAWADVLCEAFTPKVMRNWGLDHESLRAINPRLIYVSTCLGGAYGPNSQVAGFGNLGAALAGFSNLVGWADRPPAGPAGAYTDYVVPRFFVSSVLAALDHRDRTGDGQFIDISQCEASAHFIAPALLDYEVNGHVTTPDGNRSLDMAPHGVFRCAGTERWVALACASDEQWVALLGLLGPGTLSAPAATWPFAARKAHEDDIDAAITAWTTTRSAEDAQAALIAADIPAHLVADATDFSDDPQLAHRGHFIAVDHQELGEITVENARFSLSRTPARITNGAPVYGQHSNYVLREILGLSEDEVGDLAASGALT